MQNLSVVELLLDTVDLSHLLVFLQALVHQVWRSMGWILHVLIVLGHVEALTLRQVYKLVSSLVCSS